MAKSDTNVILREKCLEKVSEIEIEDIELVAKNYTNYNFLASKKGLTIHNSR